MRIEDILKLSKVIPVIVIDNVNDAVPLARALVRGGVRVLEITLRTAAALESICAIAAEVDDAIVGAGTVLNESDLQACRDAGAKFAVSPGATRELLSAANARRFPLLPGVATASEIMNGLAQGYAHFKFFPAENVGGIAALKALSAPFGQVRFCPTGGISLQSARDYLAVPSVVAVGGSWLAPTSLIAKREWAAIETIAKETVAALTLHK